MPRRLLSPTEELARRAVAYVDRRSDALIRRGGRSGGGAWGKKRFDPTKMYALSSLSAANFYQTAVGGGEAGVDTGFGSVTLWRLNSLTGASQIFAGRSGGASGGYFHNIDASNGLKVSAKSTAAFPSSPVRTLIASDVGKIFCEIGLHTGGNAMLRQYVDRSEAGAGTSASGYTPENQRSVLGNLVTGTQPATGLSLLGWFTFRGTPSDEQLKALYDQVRILGDLPLLFPLSVAGDADIAALVPRHWFRMDTFTPSAGVLGALTNRNTSVGGSLVVNAGTIALPAADALFGGAPSIVLNGTQRLVSDQPASAFAYWHKEPSFLFFIYANTATDSTDRYLITTANATATQVGFALLARGPTAENTGIYIPNGANSSYLDPILNTASGQATCLAVRLRAGMTPQAGRAPNLQNFSASFPLSSADPSRTLTIGANSGAPTGMMRLVDIIAFDRDPSDGEVQKVFDYARTRYGIGAITTTHRWSLRDYLAGLDLPVTSGQVAPTSLPDTVTAAAIDRMDRQGSPTIVSIDPGVDGRKTYGITGNSPTAYLESAAGKGIRGAATGLTVLILMRLDAAPSSTGHLVSDFLTTPSAMGYVIYGSSGQIYVYLNASNFTPICAAAAADVGRMMLVGLTWNGTTWQGYRDGATAGTPITAGWSNPNSTASMQIGRSPHDTVSAAFASIFAVGGCDVALSAVEMAQVYADFQRTGTLVMPSGKANTHVYDVTQDVVNNGGPAAGVPATVLDRVGTDNLTRVGTGLQVAQRAERLWSYEATPILYGAA